MPSFAATPARLDIVGGAATFVPARFSGTAARLRLVGGDATFSIGGETAVSVTTPKLDRIMRREEITTSERWASQRFQLIWQRTMEAIENAFVAIDVRDDNQDSILARLEAAEAQAAQAVAQSAATAAEDALTKSYPSGITLSASSDGTISISAHTRVYGDGTSVAVNGGSTSGWTFNQFVQVYYDDAGRSGGAVAYQGTTEVIAQSGSRHIVGGVSIPPVGLPPQEGQPPSPPGYVPDMRDVQTEFPA